MQAQVVNWSYDSAYEEGYNAALEAVRASRERRNHIREYVADAKAKERQENSGYFLKQRIAGLGVILASLIGIAVTGGEFGIAVAAIPAGLFIVFTKHRIFS